MTGKEFEGCDEVKIIARVDSFNIIQEERRSTGDRRLYIARDVLLGKKLILKVLPEAITASPSETALLQRSIRHTSKIDDEAIVPVLILHRIKNIQSFTDDFPLKKGQLLAVSPYREGTALSIWRRQFQSGKVPFKRALDLCYQVAAILAKSQRQNMDYDTLDLNSIFISSNGKIHLSDFAFDTVLTRASRHLRQNNSDPFHEAYRGHLTRLFLCLISGRQNMTSEQALIWLKKQSSWPTRQRKILQKAIKNETLPEHFTELLKNPLKHHIPLKRLLPLSLAIIVTAAGTAFGLPTVLTPKSKSIPYTPEVKNQDPQEFKKELLMANVFDHLENAQVSKAKNNLAQILAINPEDKQALEFTLQLQQEDRRKRLLPLKQTAEVAVEKTLNYEDSDGFRRLKKELLILQSRAESFDELAQYEKAIESYRRVHDKATALDQLNTDRTLYHRARLQLLESRQQVIEYRRHFSNLWQKSAHLTQNALKAAQRHNFTQAEKNLLQATVLCSKISAAQMDNKWQRNQQKQLRSLQNITATLILADQPNEALSQLNQQLQKALKAKIWQEENPELITRAQELIQQAIHNFQNQSTKPQAIEHAKLDKPVQEVAEPPSIFIKTLPVAQVSLDGQLLGLTPLTAKLTKDADHQLIFSRDNYQSIVHDFKANFNGRQTLSLHLKENEPIRPQAEKKWQLPELAISMTFIKTSDTHNEFWIAQHEVTQKLWKTIMATSIAEQRNKASRHWPLKGQGDNLPIYYVNWEEAMEFCRRLTDRERKLQRLTDDYIYTLPTVSQWRYVSKNRQMTPEELQSTSWNASNSADTVHPVGSKSANDFEVFDMLGNVGEWCADTQTSEGQPLGKIRLTCGGDWHEKATLCQPNKLAKGLMTSRFSNVGFRLILKKKANESLATDMQQKPLP